MATTISRQVLDEIKELRKDISALTVLLIGSADSPEPGAMERLRRVETWRTTTMRALSWLLALVGGAILLDALSRFLVWYRG